TAIIGLPLIELCTMLRHFGLNPLRPTLLPPSV
ncbi:MAG TPA: septum formation inhibitor Maf, partial [Alcaligenes faecalis]|nr:septum formation inhibitor Maf [Alcaligenes faecalis]